MALSPYSLLSERSRTLLRIFGAIIALSATISLPPLFLAWACATALAALRCGAYVPERGERVVVVVCGSNCDPSTVTA